MGGQQQVLHGREDRGVHRLWEGKACVAAHDDEEGRGSDAAHRPAVHVVEEGGGEALLLEGPCATLPQARRHGADGGAQRAVAHDDEDEGLAVLRAGVWVAAVKMRTTVGSSTSSGRNDRGGPLGLHHVEEVGRHGGDGSEQDAGPPAAPDWAAPG